MQIFCPFPPGLLRPTIDDTESAFALLDTRRLRNQVFRETWTLIRGGWPNHPAARFPKSFMAWHAQLCLAELDRREAIGISDLLWWNVQYEEFQSDAIEFPANLPEIAASHRKALTRKLWIESQSDRSAKQRLEAAFRFSRFSTPAEKEAIYEVQNYVWP